MHGHALDPLQPLADLTSPILAHTKRALEARSLANAVPLRILCLGASLTYGLRSPDGNGYRYALRGKLVADGNDVNMIGVVSHGNMSDNTMSGFPGLRIDQVAAKSNLGLEQRPNVVLLELGTNDMHQNYSVDTAHLRLGALVGRIVNAVSNVTVLVGTLLPNDDAETESNILTFNENIVGTISNLSSQGYKVSLVDFHSQWFSTADIGPDGTHPTEMGYLKMSRVFYKGIVDASRAGNITAPQQVVGVNDYKAGNDSARAGTVMDVVCQSVNSTAQAQQCSGVGRLGVLTVSFLLGGHKIWVSADFVIESYRSRSSDSERLCTLLTIERAYEEMSVSSMRSWLVS